jgi:hypothetical protein
VQVEELYINQKKALNDMATAAAAAAGVDFK